MELKLSKNTQCHLEARGKWGHWAAAWMGLSFFLRMVYYFGLMNLNDVPGGEIFFSVVLPLIVSVAFILVLKLPKLNYPIAAASLAVVLSLDYFLAEQMNFGGVLSGILLLAAAGSSVQAGTDQNDHCQNHSHYQNCCKGHLPSCIDLCLIICICTCDGSGSSSGRTLSLLDFSCAALGALTLQRRILCAASGALYLRNKIHVYSLRFFRIPYIILSCSPFVKRQPPRRR